MKMAAPPDLDTLEDIKSLDTKALFRLERDIAKYYSKDFPWFIVFWAFANLMCWLSLWPLVMFDIISLWVAFPIATINLSLVYLPTHDAQHDIIARKGDKLRWLNELVGHATSWMIIYPFEVLRVTHMEHHKHTNHPELDPDITSKANGPWHAIWRTIVERQPNGKRTKDYIETLARKGRTDLIWLAILYRLGWLAALFTLAWTGYALEAFFLWWLPYHIGMTYLLFFLSWAPHHPSEKQDRYGNTRSWKSKLGLIGSMGMEAHIVHHLHPYIPLVQTPAAYRAMRPILEARGCELGKN